MSAADALAALPLFPLRAVLFPGGRLGLKVFEARYVDLVSACWRERQPFGVVCLEQGQETGRGAVALEGVGVLAHIDAVDSDRPGVLQVRCTGGQRFRRSAEPTQLANGLWQAPATLIDDDDPEPPAADRLATVEALGQAIRKLRSIGELPMAPPLRLDDAGWVANRWCELLPIPLAARQRLMALESPAIRLQLVDEYLRGKGIVS